MKNNYNKPGLYFFAVGGFIMVCIFIYSVRSTSKAYKNYFDKFDLKFSGIVIDIKYLDHYAAYCTIKVHESNKNEFATSGELWWDYCNLKNDTARMDIRGGGVLEKGDSIFVGPSNRLVAKSGNDTIMNFPDGKDKAYELGRLNRKREITYR